jgi:hypothetical protein
MRNARSLNWRADGAAFSQRRSVNPSTSLSTLPRPQIIAVGAFLGGV